MSSICAFIPSKKILSMHSGNTKINWREFNSLSLQIIIIGLILIFNSFVEANSMSSWLFDYF